MRPTREDRGCGPYRECRWLLVAATATLLAAQGCAPPSVTIEMQVVRADRPLAKVMEAADHQGAKETTVPPGPARIYDLTRYQWARLTSPTRSAAKVTKFLQRTLVTEAGRPESLRVQPSEDESFEARMTIGTEGCCGLMLKETGLSVHEAGQESGAVFQRSLSVVRVTVVELPPTHDGGLWTWVLLDIYKTPAAAPGRRP